MSRIIQLSRPLPVKVLTICSSKLIRTKIVHIALDYMGITRSKVADIK